MLQTDAEDGGQESGFALLAVLGCVLLLATVLAPFAASSRVKLLSVAYDYDRTRLESASEAINEYLAWRLANDEPWRQSAEAGNFIALDCDNGDFAVRISIIPHARLINLNTAEATLLSAGFEKIGVGAADAASIAANVMQFRLLRPTDGEDATGVDGGFKHALFEDISELHDFEVLRGFPLSKLARVFSAHSGQAILSRLNEDIGKSAHFTIESVLFDGDAWGGEAAVVQSGGANTLGRQLASSEVAGKPTRLSSVTACGSGLDKDLARLLAEVLA